MIQYLMPFFAFLLVFLVIYALLSKTKIFGESPALNIFFSLVVAIIFISVPAAKELTLAVTPWLVVFIVCIVFIFLILTFVRGDISDIVKNPTIGIIVIIIIILIFIVSGINVLGPLIYPFMPWAPEEGVSPPALHIKHVIFHPAVLGAIILFIIAAIIAWVLTKFE